MKSRLVLGLAALGAVLGGLVGLDARDANAVSPAQIVGAYRLKLKGEGWLRSKSVPYHEETISGSAVLVLARDAADENRMKVEIRLDGKFAGGLVDLATPEPAFTGSGYIVGDSLAVIDTGASTYVNAFTVTFLRDGDRLTGNWMSVYPAADPTSGSASGLAIYFAGKRLQLRSLEAFTTAHPGSR